MTKSTLRLMYNYLLVKCGGMLVAFSYACSNFICVRLLARLVLHYHLHLYFVLCYDFGLGLHRKSGRRQREDVGFPRFHLYFVLHYDFGLHLLTKVARRNVKSFAFPTFALGVNSTLNSIVQSGVYKGNNFASSTSAVGVDSHMHPVTEGRGNVNMLPSIRRFCL